jgi:cation diffusion facilitator CzcD-associated flavoprotein CzcO
MRTPLTEFSDIPGQLPETLVPENTNVHDAAHVAIDMLNDLRIEHLSPHVIWRDLLSLTDTFRTFTSPTVVLDTFQKLGSEKKCSVGGRAQTEPRIVRIPGPNCGWIDVDFIFSVQHGQLKGNCAGIVSLVFNDQGVPQIWMLRTWLENYDGHGHPDDIEAAASRTQQENTTDGLHKTVLDAIVVGGGQAGLSAAGRLHALGIDYLLFDERSKIGDSWGDRYDSLKWHTVKEYGNLPFGRTFSPDDPDLLPKDRIATAYKAWSVAHHLQVREGIAVKSAKWDPAAQTWTVTTASSQSSHEDTYLTRNLILSTGPGYRTPTIPPWATPDQVRTSGYQGTLLHSMTYRSASAAAAAAGSPHRHGIVIGSANTAHDIAEDMARAHMAVTMVQRSPTFVMPGTWLVESQARAYNLSRPTHVPDCEQATMPLKISRELLNRSLRPVLRQHAPLYDRLEAVGFRVDRCPDAGSKILVRRGGHYVDIGACRRIVEGEIRVKGKVVRGLCGKGLVFEDGMELEADLIVLATGFEMDFRMEAKEILGAEVAGMMDDYYGPDAEGEQRAYARLAGRELPIVFLLFSSSPSLPYLMSSLTGFLLDPHLYYHGGECRMARFYSRFVALQIQKELLGEPLQPYLVGKKYAE